jgi:hypothetical protein
MTGFCGISNAGEKSVSGAFFITYQPNHARHFDNHGWLAMKITPTAGR